MENELDNNYYSRWLTTDELLQNKNIHLVSSQDNITSSALPIGQVNDKVILDDGEGHNLIIGSTGSGKTQAITLPMLYTVKASGESAIVKDTKGELFNLTAKSFKESGYEVITLNLGDPDYGNSWNPFTLPYFLYHNDKQDDAMSLVLELAETIMHESNTSDPFWQNTAASYFAGLAISLMENAKEEEINLSSISHLTIQNDEEKDLLDAYLSSISKDSPIYKNIASTFLAPMETKNSILSVLNQHLSLYTNRMSLCNMLSNTNFDFLNIGNKKVIIYLITNSNNIATDNIMNIFVSQCYYLLMQNKREKRFNVIYDGFDDIGTPIPNFVNMLELSRGNKIRFTFLIKNFIKLKELYQRDNLELFKETCVNILYLLTNDEETAQEISKLCGMKDKDSYLVSSDALKRMRIWQAILIKHRYMPYLTKLLPFYQMGVTFGDEQITLEKRDKKEIKIFDLNKYFNA